MKVAIYVPSRPAKSYRKGAYDLRRNAGLEMLRDALTRAGIDCAYCGKATAHKYGIVLVTITAQCDWFAYVAERFKWTASPRFVVVGGAGCLNVRPFRDWWDVAVFGRAEDIIVGLVKDLRAGRSPASKSIATAEHFTSKCTYKIRQARRIYPHSFKMKFRDDGSVSGGVFSEQGIGCARGCKFCAYTWHRQHLAGSATSYEGGEPREGTLLDYARDWSQLSRIKQLRHVGLDGMSQRLRKMVSKPITRDMLREFMVALDKYQTRGQLKLYAVVGYPGEREADYAEHLDDLRRIDEALPSGAGKQVSLLLGTSPFRAMPCTPAAGWKMAYRDYRANGQIQHLPGKGRVYFQGRNLWAVEFMGTDSLPSVCLDVLALRGTEKHGELIKRLCATPKFWAASSLQRLKTLERYANMPALFAASPRNKLATAYLKSYWEDKSK